MALAIQTPLGQALPPAPRHAITVHLPLWQSIHRFKDRDPEIFKLLKSMYPRFVLHTDILELSARLIDSVNLDGQGRECYIFPSLQVAAQCIDFSTSTHRGDGVVSPSKISLRIFNTAICRLFTVFFPTESKATIHDFWLNTGTGISSRLAESTLQHIDSLEEVEADVDIPATTDDEAHIAVKTRIASLLNRAPVDKSRTVTLSKDDVYLFTTGMASIYCVHRILLSKFDAPSILFGFSFHSTTHVLGDYGPGVEFFGLGDDKDLQAVKDHLASQRLKGVKIQAIYTEFPSNPLLSVPDLIQLRTICDQYDCLLVVDDTIGSFANIDVLHVADIIVTSLTKTFSGYADLMAGSAVLSPLSTHYSDLKSLFDKEYHNDLYVADAEQLGRNSHNYLSRTAVLDRNAESLVAYLQSIADDPASSITKVFYPTTNLSHKNYTPFLRPSTPELPSPGCGCLFSIDFKDIASTIAFYDNLEVHKGPHLGAHLTIALGYTLGVHGNELAWVEKYGLRETQVRISVGLEDTAELLHVFRRAVESADGEGTRAKM